MRPYALSDFGSGRRGVWHTPTNRRAQHPARTTTPPDTPRRSGLWGKNHDFLDNRREDPSMPYDPEIHHRRSTRLPGYDYSQPGAYFVTICTRNRECFLGEIIAGEMRLNDLGRIVANEWVNTEKIRCEITLAEWVIMPNHLHGIVLIGNHPSVVGAYGHREVRAYGHTPLRSPSKNLGAMVRGFKSAVTQQINHHLNTPGQPFWQRNYHEHVIRNDADLNRIREYVTDNPTRWDRDKLFRDPVRTGALHAPNESSDSP